MWYIHSCINILEELLQGMDFSASSESGTIIVDSSIITGAVDQSVLFFVFAFVVFFHWSRRQWHHPGAIPSCISDCGNGHAVAQDLPSERVRVFVVLSVVFTMSMLNIHYVNIMD